MYVFFLWEVHFLGTKHIPNNFSFSNLKFQILKKNHDFHIRNLQSNSSWYLWSFQARYYELFLIRGLTMIISIFDHCSVTEIIKRDGSMIVYHHIQKQNTPCYFDMRDASTAAALCVCQHSWAFAIIVCKIWYIANFHLDARMLEVESSLLPSSSVASLVFINFGIILLLHFFFLIFHWTKAVCPLSLH